jgi:hypothetical protein
MSGGRHRFWYHCFAAENIVPGHVEPASLENHLQQIINIDRVVKRKI